MASDKSEISSQSLQKMYDEWDEQHKDEGIRELPKITLGEDQYYVDGRLQEIRNVNDWTDSLSFNQIDMIHGYAEVMKKYVEDEKREEPQEESRY